MNTGIGSLKLSKVHPKNWNALMKNSLTLSVQIGPVGIATKFFAFLD
jgi:hypothetical protein